MVAKGLYMASRAEESTELSSLHLAKYKYFILKTKFLYLANFVNSTELSI